MSENTPETIMTETPTVPETPDIQNPDTTASPDSEAVDFAAEAAARELAAAKKRAEAAERALETERRERKRAERAQMSEAEQLEQERKDLAEKARRYDCQSNAREAEKLLLRSGLHEDEYRDLLDLFVTEDAERSIAIAQGIADIVAQKIQTAARTEREKLMKNMPTPPSGTGSGVSVTLEQYRAMNYQERLKFVNEHPDEYAKLNGG